MPVPQMPQGAFEVNGIAALVNGRVVTKNKVGFMLSKTYRELATMFPRRGAEFERQVLEAREHILQELIDREIILSEFEAMKTKGAALPDHVVKKEIDRQMTRLVVLSDTTAQAHRSPHHEACPAKRPQQVGAEQTQNTIGLHEEATP